MPPELSLSAWAQIRADYEHSETPVEDICAEHGISSATLRDRMRRWNWTRRRQPIPLDGPPPLPAPPPGPTRGRDAAPPASPPDEPAASGLPGNAPIAPVAPDGFAAPHLVPADAADAPPETDPLAIARRLQVAVSRVLPAIEATLGTLAAGNTREMERAARALAALTRTLRELNALLGRYPVPHDEGPATLDEFREDLARKIDGIIAARPKRDGGESGAA